jgi:hypothetical protein
MAEINEGVRILVERMKTNPEEFTDGLSSRWAEVVHTASGAKWLTDEEHKLLNDASDQVQRDRFTARVLKALTKEEEYFTTQENKHKHMVISPSQKAVLNKLSGGSVLTTSGSNGTSWTNSAITSSNTSVNNLMVTRDELEKTLADYVKAVNKQENYK